jgi:hypothetical protein
VMFLFLVGVSKQIPHRSSSSGSSDCVCVSTSLRCCDCECCFPLIILGENNVSLSLFCCIVRVSFRIVSYRIVVIYPYIVAIIDNVIYIQFFYYFIFIFIFIIFHQIVDLTCLASQHHTSVQKR